MNSIWLNQLTHPTHAAAVCDMFKTVTSFLWCHWLQWAWHRYSHLSCIQVNACNEAGSGTASLELTSVNHLLGCMDSCSVNRSGPCMDMFKHDCHDINVHHEAKQRKEKPFLPLSNGKSMWGEYESLHFVSNRGFSTLNVFDTESWTYVCVIIHINLIIIRYIYSCTFINNRNRQHFALPYHYNINIYIEKWNG